MTVVEHTTGSHRVSVGPSKANGRLREEPNLAVAAESTIAELVQLFKLLADETRLRILSFLQQTEELNVRQLCKLLHQRQPSVSHHLALLRAAGVLDMRREGKHNFYRLLPSRVEQLVRLDFGCPSAHSAAACFDRLGLDYSPLGNSGSS